MGHCINAIITKDFDNVTYPHVKLPQGLIMIPANLSAQYDDEFIKDRLFVEIYTDYFGGCGNQGAVAYLNGVQIKKYFDNEYNFDIESSPINYAMAEQFGITPDGRNDIFDTLGLGQYRDQDDLEEACCK